jgi:6-phosphogluconolactonase
MKRAFLALILAAGVAATLFAHLPNRSSAGAQGTTVSIAASRPILIGTYTGPSSRGIHAAWFDDSTGALTLRGLAAETPNPSFLEASADGRFVFAVNEVSNFGGERSGSVTSFAVEYPRGNATPSPTLVAISVQSTHGADPCHLTLDRTGRFLAVANYTGGNFSIFPVGTDGRLGPATATLGNTGSGPNRQRQTGPHGHQVLFDASNRYLLGVDLGLDRVHVYKFDPATGRATANDPASVSIAAGAGPRHLAFHPNGRFAFVISEINSTISSLSWTAATGRFAVLSAVSTLPPDAKPGSSTAEIAVHPSGRFIYGSNRGHDSIAVFSIAGDGALTLVEHESTRGQTPRNFSIDPAGKWLIAANQGSNTLAVFRIDQKTGALDPVGPLVSVGAPVSILFMPVK